MISEVLIFSLLIIFATYSSSNYIFAQNNESEVNEIPTLKQLIEEGTLTIEKIISNRTTEFEWKTCLSELGFTIEYPVFFYSKKELENISLTEDTMERHKYLDSKYNWIDDFLVDKLQKFLEENSYTNYFARLNLTQSTDVDSCSIYGEYYVSGLEVYGPYYLFKVFTEPFKYDSIKVLTRNSFLDLYKSNEIFKIVYPLGDGLSYIEKPKFDKYTVDGEKTGSYFFKRSSEWEKILTIHNNTLYIFEIMFPSYEFNSNDYNSKAKEEVVSIRNHMINSIKWVD